MPEYMVELYCGECNEVIAWHYSTGAPHACSYYCRDCKDELEKEEQEK